MANQEQVGSSAERVHSCLIDREVTDDRSHFQIVGDDYSLKIKFAA
jgi:hypothetical protein